LSNKSPEEEQVIFCARLVGTYNSFCGTITRSD
jgi:hypothetical protein